MQELAQAMGTDTTATDNSMADDAMMGASGPGCAAEHTRNRSDGRDCARVTGR